MPHGADMGAAAAANLAEQQERSTVGMKTKSKVPSSKSKGTFQGYGGDAPLQTTEAKMETTRRGVNGRPPARPPLHPWLDYPPNFKRAVAKNVAVVQRTLHPSIIFAPLPAELKYTLTRNFGFFTKIFTLPFDKVRATYPEHHRAPTTLPPRSRRPSLPSRVPSSSSATPSRDPIRSVPLHPILPRSRSPSNPPRVFESTGWGQDRAGVRRPGQVSGARV